MRVEVDSWAWLPLDGMDEAAVRRMKESLTIVPKQVEDYDDGEDRPIHLFSLDRDGFIGVPRMYFLSKARHDHELIDTATEGEEINVESVVRQEGEFEEQAKATEAFLKMHSEGKLGGILQARPAWGKTAWALNLIAKIGRAALVVVSREFLMNQWRDRIKKFLPNAKVGIVQQDVCEYEGMDIVIAMVHSLAKKEYPPGLYEKFGVVVLDEVHRVPAYTWSKVPPMFPAAFRVGLSATPRRKDGADAVFLWHIGEVVFKATSQTNKPKVRRVFTGWVLPQKLQEARNRGRQIKMPTVLKVMVLNEGRNKQIVDEIIKAVRSPSKRKVLVLSDRLNHLEKLRDMLVEAGDPPRIDFYIGGRKEAELKEAERAQVVLATFQMAFEALDIAALDTVMLTTPRGDVEQPVGRVQRWCRPEPEKCQRLCPWRSGECKEKPQPIVVDFMDDESESKGRAAGRMRLYKREGFI